MTGGTIALAAAFAPAQANAPTGELNIGTADRHVLSRSFMFFEDPGAQLALADILAPAVQARFKPVEQSGPGTNFGLTRSAIWLRIKLNPAPDAPPDWLLEVAYPPLDQIELWTPAPTGQWQRQLAGDLRPFTSRAVVHRNHVLPVTLGQAGPTTLYLRLQSQGTVSAPVNLWRPGALWASDQRSYAGLSLYFGLLMGLLLYNLLLFVSVRDPVYLIYVLFVGGMALVQTALTGFGYQFLWPGKLWWNSVSPPAAIAIAAVFGMVFARTFLASAARMPGWDKLILALIAGWLASLAAALALPYTWSSWMTTVLAAASVATLMALGVLSVRHGHAGARQFLTAWALLLLGVFTLFLHNIGALPSNVFTLNSLLIGSAAEMVLLSFALADRINVARRFKEQAQVRIAAEHALVEALGRSQKQLTTALDERETILETSIVGIAFLTPDGRFRWANQAMHTIFGVQGRRIVSIEPFYLSREHYRAVGAEVAACVARGEIFENEMQMRRSDGTPIWILMSGKAVSRLDLGQGTVWVIMNITRRKQLEAQLQLTTAEREAILNSALVGIVLSVSRRHEWVNEKFAQMVGYPRESLLGQSSVALHLDEAAWEQFGKRARVQLTQSGSFTCEHRLKRSGGEMFWVEMSGNCLRPNDPDAGVIWTFLDITQRKDAEAASRDALNRQQNLNELRTRFVAMTSHELRTPLAAILSAEELLRHYGDRLPQPERIDILDGISAGVQRMSRMVDRVLLLGQADAQMLRFEPELIDLPAFCRQLVEEARAQEPANASEVLVRCEPDMGPGRFDPQLLRHIFGNLLSNALKYSPSGGRVVFAVHGEGAQTVFEVSDHGIGIPAGEIAHLFESFHRASNVGAIPGTGLGLAIVRNAVQMHGGTIEVESIAGEATRFTVRLAAAAAA